MEDILDFFIEFLWVFILLFWIIKPIIFRKKETFKYEDIIERNTLKKIGDSVVFDLKKEKVGKRQW